MAIKCFSHRSQFTLFTQPFLENNKCSEILSTLAILKIKAKFILLLYILKHFENKIKLIRHFKFKEIY